MSQLVECSSLPPFEIHIKDQRPLRQRCYRQTPEAKAEIRRQIDALKKNGLVEPTQSLWNSPILLVRKANGSYRMCTDFRKVNQVTFPQYQSLVSVTEVVDFFGERKPKIFSTLDMFSGYHQVKMAEDSKKFTGFTIPDGEHLAFNRLCFGLCNAPAHLCVQSKGYFNILSIDIVRFILMTSSSFHRM